jgi:hypothetical protein
MSRPLGLLCRFFGCIVCGWLLAASPARSQELKEINEVFRSRAEVIHAEGQNKMANAAIINAVANHMKAGAESAKINQETRKLSAENDRLETQVFYDKKAMYYSYQDAHKPVRSTPDQLAERARQSAPTRLSSYQLWSKEGYLRWPGLLLHGDYAEARSGIDYLFAMRTAADSGAGSQNCVDLQARIGTLRDTLHNNLKRYKPVDYLAARKFLDSLAYEAQFQAEGVAKTAAVGR